ncbi:MAG: tRNA-uridine aminocarboxypropyltransferase [Planctomycetota bacterium]
MQVPTEPRPRCYRCRRPTSMCFCADVPTVATRTKLVILQHPREHRHPFGTARMVSLALSNSRLEVPRARTSGALDADLALPEDAAVLFPHPQAHDLAGMRAADHPRTLVVLDGTWSQAKGLYRHNPWLHACRHVRLHPAEASRYRIRREPRADYVSTVEAIVGALRILEPDNGELEALLVAFERMIDRQIGHLDSAPRRARRKHARQRPSRRLPPELRDRDLIVVYGETSMPAGDPAAPRALVQWTAVKVATGEVFDRIVQPRAATPTTEHLQHMGLRSDDLASGLTLADVRSEFASFASAAPTVAAWSKNTLAWGDDVMDPNSTRIVLKTCYCNVRSAKPGFLEQVVARERLVSPPLPCRGRAATRLASALALARWLQTHRVESDSSLLLR